MRDAHSSSLGATAAALSVVVAACAYCAYRRSTSTGGERLTALTNSAELWVAYRLWVDSNVTAAKEQRFHAFVFAHVMGRMALAAKSGSEAADALIGSLQRAGPVSESQMTCRLQTVCNAFDARLSVGRAAEVGDGQQLASLLDGSAVGHIDEELPHRGEPALHTAARAGHAAAVALLLARGANVHARTATDGSEPIHAAVQSAQCAEILALILCHGADVQARTTNQSTALHVAAYHGRLSAVKQLLARGADVLAIDGEGYRPVCWANRWLVGACPCEQVLYDPSREWAAVATVLERLEGMQGPAMKETGREEAQRSWALYVSSVLQLPCERGDVDALAHLLLCYQEEVDAQDYDGSTALHAAARAGHTEALRMLLDCRADVHTKTHLGDTALHFAAGEGHLAAVELLLSRGGEPGAMARGGATPRERAIRGREREWLAVAELLEPPNASPGS